MNKPMTREEIDFQEFYGDEDHYNNNEHKETASYYWHAAAEKYQQKRIDQHEEECQGWRESVDRQRNYIGKLQSKIEMLESLGCPNCHKLYFELTAKIKELEKEIEQLTLKPSTQKVANCLCCQKIKKVEEIDKKTGCCEGGCK